MTGKMEIPIEAYGVGRVLEPTNAPPQAAQRLDASSAMAEIEMEIRVDTSRPDSTCFRQPVESNDRAAGCVH